VLPRIRRGHTDQIDLHGDSGRLQRYCRKEDKQSTRNERGSRVVNFAVSNHLNIMNTCFQKSEKRQWIWRSADGRTLNQTDFVLTDTKRIFSDVSVIGEKIISKGSDHRLLHSTLMLKVKRENGMLKKGCPPRRNLNADTFSNLMETIDFSMNCTNIDKDNEQFVANILKATILQVKKSFQQGKDKSGKRQWIWRSADGRTLNQTDFVLTDTKRIFSDVSVIGEKIISKGSDHRLLHSTLMLKVKRENGMLKKGCPPRRNLNADTFSNLMETIDFSMNCTNIDKTMSNSLLTF
uniref:Endo/exonuclease/phosphatase domain-containing protein n=1 Tax=Ascaris lumbricoides TaxID=6252 RepID=A0A0M3II41_ASCLU